MDEIINVLSNFHVYLIVFFSAIVVYAVFGLFQFRRAHRKLALSGTLFLSFSALYLLLWLFSDWLGSVSNNYLWYLKVIITIFSALYLLLWLFSDWLGSVSNNYLWYLKVIITIWWLTFCFTLIHFLDYFIWNGILVRNGTPVVPKILTDMVAGVIYFGTLMAILKFGFGKSVTGLLATSGVLAIILGYSAQNTFGDLFAGLALNIDRKFRLGQWIQVEGTLGEIVDVNWRSVVLSDHDLNRIAIPNSLMAKQKVTNLSEPEPTRRVSVLILVDDAHSPHLVKQALVKSALESEQVVSDPPPQAVINASKIDGIEYALQVFTRHMDDTKVKDGVISAIWYRFQREGIQLAQRHQDVILHRPSAKFSEEPMCVEAVKRHIETVPIFQLLQEEEKIALAKSVRRFQCGPPERVLVQGAPGDSMFIVEKGTLAVFVRTPDNPSLRVAELGPGTVVGEMALLTGEPRTATVRAESDAVLYEISKTALEPILERRKEVVEQISRLLAVRQMETDSKVQENHRFQEGRRNQIETLSGRLAQRIRDLFFG